MQMNNDGPFMWMWFHTKIQDTVLFKTWNVTTVGTLLLACFLIIVAGVILEGIKYLRFRLKRWQDSREINSRYLTRLLSAAHFTQTILFLFQLGFGYCLMLIFMTFSIWLGIAVIVGLTIGYLIFGYRTLGS